MKSRGLFLLAVLILGLLCGCGNAQTETAGEVVDLGGLQDEAVPLAGAPNLGAVLELSAPGTALKENDTAAIDYSNLKDGYVMVRWKSGGQARIKVLVKGPSGVSYQYNLRTDGTYEAFPLSDGNGKYTVGVYQNVSGSKYATALSMSADVALTDEFAPFLRPNQYVNFNSESSAVKKAAELCAGRTDNLDKVRAIYQYVIDHVVYDYDKAKTVQSGYLPNVDDTLSAGKGICFDYAALMTAMLRSQRVPAKLVVGYTGDLYHAWISVYSETQGWIEGKIYFNGTVWKLMDPTFASGGKTDSSVQAYINNEANYQAKYLY